MRSFRVLCILLAIIFLIPIGPLLSRTSSTGGTVLGQYSLRYAILLAAYALIPLSLATLAFAARSRLVSFLIRPVQWLQQRPVLLIAVLYALVEIWYFAKRVLANTRFFGIGQDFVMILAFMALLELFVAGILLFAGRTPESRRALAVNLAILLVSSTIAFVALSIGYAGIVRRAAYLPAHVFWGEMHQPDPYLGYRPAPGLRDFPVYFDEEARDVTYTTDQRGFRNREDTSAAPIAGIGDSFIFGLFVDQDDIWSERLSQTLGLPIANYGVSGYSLWQYNRAAELATREPGHRLLIYGIVPNDLALYIDGAPYIPMYQRWEIWPFRSPINYTIDELLSESPGYQLMQALTGVGQPDPTERLQAAEEAPRIPPYGFAPLCIPYTAMYNDGPEHRQMIAQQMDQAIELAEERNYRLLVVTIPSKESVYEEELIPACGGEAATSIAKERSGFAFICEYLTQRGYPCYNMTDDFRAAADSSGVPLYYLVDGHWNADGHAVFADLLAAYLREHDLIEP